MSKQALLISAAVVGLLATTPAISKGTLFQLPLVSGSTETIAFGINDKGIITGFYLTSSGVEDGFVGPDDGSNYTTFEDSTDPDTQPRGINTAGIITGIDNSLSGNPTTYIPFERSAKGKITNVTMKGTTLNYLIQGINTKGTFDGNYENTSLQYIGYTGADAKYKKEIKLPGVKSTGVAGRGINDAGDTVGWYLDSSAVQHGFLVSGGKTTTIDNPGGTTSLEGINNKGEISGLYVDSSSNRHGFIYDIKTKKFTELTVSGSTFVEVWGLNDDGLVAIDGENSSAVFVGYVYCPTTKNCPTAAGASEPPAVLRAGAHIPQQVP